MRPDLALLAACLLLACQTSEPDDPLDPDVIQEAAEAEGDARGTDFSGRFDLSLDTTGACNCPEIAGMDLCHNELTTLTTAGGSATLTQSDGYLVLSADEGLLSLTGAIDDDDSFDLAGIYGFGAVVGEVSLYIHLLGGFSSQDRFSATLHSRTRGTFNGEAVDCRTEIPLYGTRSKS